ncbi:endonuclease domain-containing protein [Leptothrix sp. BB-4]
MEEAEDFTAWIADRARSLRREQTPQEMELWRCLRSRRLARFKFRRQVPIGRYVADFVCFSARLIVELDGGQHSEQRPHDLARDAWLSEQGFQIIRVWNHEWASQRIDVMTRIWLSLNRDCDAVDLAGGLASPPQYSVSTAASKR